MNRQEKLAELARDLKIHLLENHDLKEWIFSKRESYLFFKEEVRQSRPQSAPPVKERTERKLPAPLPIPPPPRQSLPPAIKPKEEAPKKEALVEKGGSDSFKDLFLFFEKAGKGALLCETPKGDQRAKEVKGALRAREKGAKIFLLANDSSEDPENFFNELADFLHVWAAPTALLHLSASDPAKLREARLILGQEGALSALFAKEAGEGGPAILPLVSPDDYTKHPQKKRELFEALSERLPLK
jgi:hypothetical protein